MVFLGAAGPPAPGTREARLGPVCSRKGSEQEARAEAATNVNNDWSGGGSGANKDNSKSNSNNKAASVRATGTKTAVAVRAAAGAGARAALEEGRRHEIDYSVYYAMNCFRGGVLVQLFGGIGTAPLWTGAVIDTNYNKRAGYMQE